jgi:hypothetical protein
MATQMDPWTLANEHYKQMMAFAEQDQRNAAYLTAKKADAQIAANRADVDFGRDLQKLDYASQLKAQGGRLKGRLHGGTSGVGGGADIGGLGPGSAYQYYINKGVNPMVAAGIVGNLDVESAWDPAVWEGRRRGDAGSAAFAAQWRGDRQTGLIQFAQERGHPAPTPQDQLDYILHEAETGSDPGARKAITMMAQASSPEESAQIFELYFERANPQFSNSKRRQSVAAQVYSNTGGNPSGITSEDTRFASNDPRRYTKGVEPTPGTTTPWTGPGSQAPGMPLQTTNAGANSPQGPATSSNTPFDPSSVAGDYRWTDADKRSFLSEGEYNMLPPDMDIVGPGAKYSSEALQHLGGTEGTGLFALGNTTGDDGTEYLWLVPKAVPTQQPTQQPDQTTTTSIPPQTMSPAGTQAPPVQTQQPTQRPPWGGQRTRQRPDGTWEMNVSGTWVPLSG